MSNGWECIFKMKITNNLNEAIATFRSFTEEPGTDYHLVPQDTENSFVGELHSTDGRWMRNNWGLWTQDSDLYSWFVSRGITHPDDMTGIILTSFYRVEHDLKIDLEGQIQEYKDYWKKYNE